MNVICQTNLVINTQLARIPTDPTLVNAMWVIMVTELLVKVKFAFLPTTTYICILPICVQVCDVRFPKRMFHVSERFTLRFVLDKNVKP